MFDFFKHKFFGPAAVHTGCVVAGRELTPAEVVRKEARNEKLRVMRDDLAEHRKLAWLRTQRPRLTKGKSGFWWCVSEHKTPDGRSTRQRIGAGETLRAAYNAWMED